MNVYNFQTSVAPPGIMGTHDRLVTPANPVAVTLQDPQVWSVTQSVDSVHVLVGSVDARVMLAQTGHLVSRMDSVCVSHESTDS